MYFKKIKFIKYIIILPIIYLFSIELILRLLIFIFTLNSSILIYGINNNITLTLHSLKKLELHISDNQKAFNPKNNQRDNANQIWIFGGSTSNSGFCDSKNLSWVDLLEVNLKKKNFARNGVNSNFSLNVLKSELQKNDPPKTIIWAHKVNEINHGHKNNISINNFFYFTNSLKKSIKNRLLIFYFFDELTLRLFDKLKIDLRYKKNILIKSDYTNASENYYKNTKIAIKLAKLYNVEKFYIISLFNKMNLDNYETQFYEYYYSKTLDLIKLESIVKFVNTKNYLKHDDKSKKLFCDPMHQTFQGKFLTAEIISNFINDKK